MGLIQKLLFVMTGGLSGLVFKDHSKKAPTAPAKKPARVQAQAKATRPKAKTARRAKPRAARATTQATSGNGTAGDIERLASLHKQGVLTTDEFTAAKAKILGTSATPHEPRSEPAPAPAPAPASAPAPAPAPSRVTAPHLTPPTYPAVAANVAAARHITELTGAERAPVATISSD